MSTFSSPASRPARICLAVVILLVTYFAIHGRRSSNATTNHGLQAATIPGHKARYAIISMTTAETSYDWMSFSDKHTYAKKHGYDLIWDFEPSREYIKVWDKLNLTRDAITSSLAGETAYEWIWMLDFDTLITNTSTLISDVVEESLAFAGAEGKSSADIDLLLTRDCEPLNMGSCLIRASAWSVDFIEQWRVGADVLDEKGMLRNEQDVMRDMLHDDAFSVADHSVMAPQHLFDAYPPEIECYDPRDPRPWEPGMFVMHFAGARWRFKEQKDPIGSLMRKYFQAVV